MAIAAIKDVAHSSSPATGHLTQEPFLLQARLSRHPLVSLPPTHGDHLGDAVSSHQQETFPLIAVHPHWDPAGLSVDIFAAAPQTSRFAGTHGAQAF
jgi:hypothetical protein